MKEIVSTITGKGQVTIPAEVRRSLGVAPSDKVTFVIDETGKVELRPVRYTVASLKGILPKLKPPPSDDFEDEIATINEEHVKRILAEE